MDVNENIELLLEGLCNRVPFYRLLGLTRDCFDVENACIRFPWRDEFMGNTRRKMMHGGVISAILDAVGGFVIPLHRIKESTPKEKWRTSTIDLRVDYLLPGKGRHFVASGSILRFGKRVAVVRMELHNDEQELIAVGMGTFMIG